MPVDQSFMLSSRLNLHIWLNQTLMGAFCVFVRTMIAASGRPLSRPSSSWCWRCVATWPPSWRAWWATGSCPSATPTPRPPLPPVRPSRPLSHPPNSRKLSASARTRSWMWVVGWFQCRESQISTVPHLIVFILQVLQDILLKETADTLSDPQ